MQRVLPCLSHSRVSTRDSHTLLLAPMAPLLPSRETALLLTQVPQASSIVPGVGDLFPGGEGRQVYKAEIHPYQFARAWAQGSRNLGTEAHVVRPARIPQEAHHVGPLDVGKLFSEFQNSKLGEPQHSRSPRCARALKPKALAAALGLETRIACMPAKEAAESPILIAQALCQGRCWHLDEPLMPCRALPLRQPSREIIAREGEATGAVCF